VKAVLDTNILIDYLRGIPSAKEEILRYRSPLISILTKMEVLAGVNGTEEESQIRTFLARFQMIGLEDTIAERAIQLRKSLRIKMPDAIIYATAQQEDCLLVTRNTKDFPSDLPDVRCPYTL
jgi:predicted nucleic acid-binding protein